MFSSRHRYLRIVTPLGQVGTRFQSSRRKPVRRRTRTGTQKVMEPMSETPPGHRSRIIAIVLVLILIGAVPSAYLVFYSSQPKKAPSRGFTVDSNKVVLVELPGFNYSGGIWQLQLSNNGNSKQFATYQLLENGNLADGNSSTLQPGQRINVTVCLNLATESSTFRVSIFVSNSSGTFSKDYPVATENATQTKYSGQFTATNDLSVSAYNSEFQRNSSEWSITLHNTNTKPIKFAYAELWSNTTLLSATFLLCAGSSTPPSSYGQSLAPGQATNDTRQLDGTGLAVAAGKTYRVDVVAVYSDFSEVFQSYFVQAKA